MSDQSTSDQAAQEPDDGWRATVKILFVVHLMTASGFNLVAPFLPLYVKQLRRVLVRSVAFWSGMIFSAPAVTMMLAAPLWGLLADRYGRKLMLVRSTMAGGAVLALMGFVRSAEQLALLRAGQGALSGYISASNALVASTTPRAHIGESFGLLRTATWIGAGLGPLLGGVVGEHVGFRESFWITGGLLGLSGLLVVFGIRERFVPRTSTRGGGLATYLELLRVPELRRVYSLSFLDALGRSMLMPIVPLFMLKLAGSPTNVATLTGVLLGLRAFTGAAASIWVGRLGDRIGHGRVVVLGSLALLFLYLPQPLVNQPWQLMVLQVLVGLAAVGVVPGIGSLMGLYVPEGNAGATFGLESSLDSLARTMGPMIGAAMAYAFGLSHVFTLTSVIYLALAIRALPFYRVVADSPQKNL